jgi:hypothetical protein
VTVFIEAEAFVGVAPHVNAAAIAVGTDAESMAPRASVWSPFDIKSIASSKELSASPAAPIAAAAKSVTAKTEGSSPAPVNLTRFKCSSLPCAASQIALSNCGAKLFEVMMVDILCAS